MDPHISVVMAMLYGVAYHTDESEAGVIPEADFVPFNLSYLRDFPAQDQQEKNPFGGRGQNASQAVPA